MCLFNRLKLLLMWQVQLGWPGSLLALHILNRILGYTIQDLRCSESTPESLVLVFKEHGDS